jgi:hypothetical protein
MIKNIKKTIFIKYIFLYFFVEMTINISKQRLYASLLILGSAILLFRTIHMLVYDAFDYLVLWVFVLLIAELLIDAGCLISSIWWWITNDPSNDSIPLRFGAAATILHAIRVGIFAMGRFGPWINFDVRPEHQALHHTRWTWPHVYFAIVMSCLGLLGVFIIWQLRKRSLARRHTD